MKAAVLKSPRVLRVEEAPVATLKDDEVLVRVKVCGICGSDLRYFLGENPWALHTLGVEKPNPPNIILGHEFAGEVVQVGSPVFEHLKGKRVVASPYRACGVCRSCRMGRYNLCADTIHLGHGAGWGDLPYYPGGMADYCPVWADKAFVLPDSVSYEEAALLDIVGIAVHAADIGGVRAGTDAAILGAGPLGMSLVQIARIWGAKTVICTDRFAGPLRLARELGADEALLADGDAVVHRVMECTGGFGASAVFDTVCSPETFRTALRILAPAGTLVNLATNASAVSLKLLDLGSERAVRSSSNYYFHDFQLALDLAASGRLRLKPMITHRVPLREVNRGFDMLLNKEQFQATKVIVEI